jgi:hypothetical protein
MQKTIHILGATWVFGILAIVVIDGIYGIWTRGLPSMEANLDPARAAVIVLIEIPGIALLMLAEKIKNKP